MKDEMDSAQIEDRQRKVSDLADKILGEAIRKGERFSEGLCSWAISKAEQDVDYES